MELLKVAALSTPKSVAGAIAMIVHRDGGVMLQAVGARAVNQAIKAIIIARGYVTPNGIDLITVPAFTKVEIDGVEKTAMKLLVKPREKATEV